MIKGGITNPFQFIANLKALGVKYGATTVRLQGTLANEELENVLKTRYGMTSSGAVDTITIKL